MLIAAASPAAAPARSARTDSAPVLAAGMVSPLPIPMNMQGPKKARAWVAPDIDRTRPTKSPMHVRRRNGRLRRSKKKEDADIASESAADRRHDENGNGRQCDRPATERLTRAKSAWKVAAIFGSDGKIMFTGNAESAESNMRGARRGYVFHTRLKARLRGLRIIHDNRTMSVDAICSAFAPFPPSASDGFRCR